MNARFSHLLVAVLWVALLSPSTQATSIGFQEDVSPGGGYQGIATFIRSRSQSGLNNRNFGEGAAILIGQIASNGSDITRGLFGYDISSIPAGATIDSVTLTLYGQQADGGSSSIDHDINLHELTGSIIEGDGTGASWTTGPSWNNRDINGPVAWTSVGGDFNPTVLSTVTDNPATLANGDVLAFASSPSFVSAAQIALDGSGTFYMLAKATSEGTGVRGLFSIHSDEPDPGISSDQHPLLTIEYTAIPEPGSVVLMLCGGLGLLSMRRHR